MDFFTKAKLKILGQKYEYTQLKKLNKDILESVLVLERALINGVISFAAIDRLLWELTIRQFLDQREFVKVLTILLRRGEYIIPKDQKARALFYVKSIYCTLLILNNMPSYEMLKAMFEGSQAEYFQKEIKKLWELSLKLGIDSLLFQTVCVFVQDFDTFAFKADSKFSFLPLLKDSQKLITISGMSRIENAFDLFPWMPKIHYLFSKYKGQFCQDLRAAIFVKKEYNDPIDNDLQQLLPISTTRLLLYDVDQSGKVFINPMKFFQLVIPVFEDELRKKKKDQRLERQILFRRPGFLDRVMKNFNTIFGGHFWNEFVGKFLREFSKKNLDLNNSKHMFHVHLLFREHFAFMLKKLYQMPPQILHFLRLILQSCNKVFPIKRRAVSSTDSLTRHNSARTHFDDDIPGSESTLRTEDLIKRLHQPLTEEEKLGPARRSETHFQVKGVPKDYTQELLPIFNFFYLSFIVSNNIVQLDKDQNAKIQKALVFMTKIIMNICYSKKFQEGDQNHLYMLNACVNDWHRDLGYTTLKLLGEGPGLSLIKSEENEDELSRSLSQAYDEQKFKLSLIGKKTMVPFSMVRLDYNVVMRCVNELSQKQYPELKAKNEDLLPLLKQDIEDSESFEAVAALFNAFGS